MIKYFVHFPGVNSTVLGLKYDATIKEVVVGGYTRDEDMMIYLIEGYFHHVIAAGERKLVQKNKAVYTFKMAKTDEAFKALAQIRKDGYVLSKTTSFHKLMR